MRFHTIRQYPLSAFAAIALSSATLLAETDPGPRGGPANAGGFYTTLNAPERNYFARSLDTFREVDSVSGTMSGEEGAGLGPTFNGNSCAMCHSQPAVGGSSPGITSKQNAVPNPQVALATLHGAMNTVPSFISLQGPVREARFVFGADRNTRDGGVHGLFTIRGRSDAPGCQLPQTDFAAQLARNNVVFRIPTPTFGLGLVENTPDAALSANLDANQAAKTALQISGRFNRNGNDGTISRFGWKAQNKSLLIFAGEAYNVEQGVSNELFPNERSSVDGCIHNASPEDAPEITPLSDVAATSRSSPPSCDCLRHPRQLHRPLPKTTDRRFSNRWAARCVTPRRSPPVALRIRG